MADKETVDKLMEWELSMYIDTFKTLAHLDESEYLKELVPSWGDQIKFKAKVQEFRNSNEKDSELAWLRGTVSPFAVLVDTLSSIKHDMKFGNLGGNGWVTPLVSGESNLKDQEFLNTLEYPIDILPGSSTQIQLCTSTPYMINEVRDLHSLLTKTTEGRHLLKLKKLNEKSRQQLCQIIAREILASDAQHAVTCLTYRHWIKQIVDIFPNENSDTYFRTAVIKCQKKSLGKLYHCVGNLKKKYREQGIITPRSLRSDSLNSSVSSESKRPIPSTIVEALASNLEEVNVEADLEWLRHSTEPINIVLEKWKTTAKERLQRVFSTNGPSTDDYICEFPCIKKSYAFDLVAADFEVSFPNLKKQSFREISTYKN